jgi:hypothetical protein
MNRVSVLIAPAAAALAVAACGSAGTSNTAFTDRANAICAGSLQALQSVPSSAGTLAIRSYAVDLSTMSAKLAALSPPPGHARAYEAVVSANELMASSMRQLGRAVAAEDWSKATALEAEQRMIASTNKSSAAAAGVEQCG